ncbi:UNVERIFIED_CONTAM: Kanadaptin [Sesamum indicum]
MGPPPPPKDSTAEPSTCEATKSTAMAPPPPRNLKSSESGHEPESSENLPNEPDLNPPRTHTSENLNRLPDSTNNSTNGTSADAEKKQEQRNNNAAVPYTIPAWSAPPGHQFVLEVLKDGAIIDQFDVNKKGAYMFGRVDLCDFVLEHPTISRFHAVLQFKSNGGAYLYDLGSTHGTFINKNQIAHMKKEIDAIRAKDIAQGGLTQGQQTQIARNEQRISQIMEELENLEETLNESIRESIGARAGKSSRGKKKGNVEDEEEDYLSDEDEFYDRTQKPSKHKSGENQSIETADSLLDKKDTLVKQIEDKEKLLLNEDRPTETNAVTETGDALDAYMSTVSSQLVLDNKEKLRKELSTLQSELDRILYLLRIADPTGEAAKKRVSKEQKPKAIGKENPVSDAGGPRKREKHTVGPSSENGEIFGREVKSSEEKASVEAKSESDVNREEPESVADESTATVFTVPKPQWLGAVGDTKKQEITQELPAEQEQEQFVDYKDRGKILNKTDSSLGDQGIEAAAPGLIIRKRKEVEKSEVSEVKESKQTVGSEFKAEDAIALLLKHSRGYHASDEEDRPVSEEVLLENEGRKDGKRPKRVLGPERSSFLSEPDYSSWVPPEGQSGDGRTTLNDRFGY